MGDAVAAPQGTAPMLFNSYEFIFVYFPVVLIGFFLLGSRSRRMAAGFLALASLFFYGWWSPAALPWLLGSIAVNYGFGLALARLAQSPGAKRRGLLVLALGANLGLLAVFKYADFFVANANMALAAAGQGPIEALRLVLPIGISFYTFTQIAFLVDCWQGKVRETSFVHYVLFVSYFPHLVAGPVLHHAQMMPQFADAATYRPSGHKLALGLATFTVGLGKKLLLADPLGQCADLVFGAARDGVVLNALTAWLGVLAYTFQIYFDFSGYSDMAIGLSLCLGISLPLNFMAPYRATSIIEFWRRWHISLSTFLRDYLYIPLGGNRLGVARRHINLFLTMLLGGLWHGAAWTFVLWGAAHGLLLALNHLWRAWVPQQLRALRGMTVLAWGLTFVLVCLTWVLFRADNLDAALAIYRSLFGAAGDVPSMAFASLEPTFKKATLFKTLLAALLICLLLPRSDQLARYVPSPAWAGERLWGVVVCALLFVGLFMAAVSRLGQHSPFLYFQF
jgi:alginate O-acetyltransferase complex protein AlgI